MRTHFVGAVELDPERLGADLDRASSFTWSEAYSDYLFGGAWRNCMVYAPGGSIGDGVVTHYDTDQPAAFTSYGHQLPYLKELLTATARLERLNFARLVRVSNSVIIPHRDLLELTDVPETARNAHRLHIPLVTHDQCFFAEDETVYRMRAGEIWFLDASRLHSVAAFTDRPRIHLMLDFVDGPGSPLRRPAADERTGIPADSIVPRPQLPDATGAGLLGLAGVISPDTLAEVFSIVIKHHFRYATGPDFVWRTMFAIADASGDRAVAAELSRRHRHYTLERSEGELLATDAA